MMFRFGQRFYRRSVSYVLEVKEVEQTEGDDDGEPETPGKHAGGQTGRIRRGEPVDRLISEI